MTLRLFISILLLSLYIDGFSQDSTIVVIDGYFTNLDSTFAVSRLSDRIEKIEFVNKEIEKNLNGLFPEIQFLVIETDYQDANQTSTIFEGDFKLFSDFPKFYLNDSSIVLSDLQKVDPNNIDAIEVLRPFSAVKALGLDYKGGLVRITTKK